MSNGTQTKGDLIHRFGIWAAVLGTAAYVFSMGSWVGRAEERFKDADTVEQTQQALLITVNTVAVKQEALETAVKENKKAIEDSRKEILDAIHEAGN